MNSPVPVALGLAAVLSLTACTSGSSGHRSPQSATGNSGNTAITTGSGGPTDVPTTVTKTAKGLVGQLIAASQIPGDTFTLGATAPVSSGGIDDVTGTYTNKAGNRNVGITIFALGSSAEATTAAKAADTGTKSQFVGDVNDGALPVGGEGHLIQGKTTSNGALTVVVFTKGSDYVLMEFNSPGTDPLPAQLATQVAKAQYAKLKS